MSPPARGKQTEERNLVNAVSKMQQSNSPLGNSAGEVAGRMARFLPQLNYNSRKLWQKKLHS